MSEAERELEQMHREYTERARVRRDREREKMQRRLQIAAIDRARAASKVAE